MHLHVTSATDNGPLRDGRVRLHDPRCFLKLSWETLWRVNQSCSHYFQKLSKECELDVLVLECRLYSFMPCFVQIISKQIDTNSITTTDYN